MAKKFFPIESAMTKVEVIDMIFERRFDVKAFKKLKEPNPAFLTDPIMQKFVNDWYNTYMDISTEIGPETACEEQEKVLLALAKQLSIEPPPKPEEVKSYFTVEYQLAGQNGGGEWLVAATSKKEAKKIVKGIDEDYVKLVATSKEEWLKSNGDEDAWNEMIEENKTDLEKDGCAQLWCGT